MGSLVNWSTEVHASVDACSYEIVNNTHNVASTLIQFMQKRGAVMHVGMCCVTMDGTVLAHGFIRKKKEK